MNWKLISPYFNIDITVLKKRLLYKIIHFNRHCFLCIKNINLKDRKTINGQQKHDHLYWSSDTGQIQEMTFIAIQIHGPINRNTLESCLFKSILIIRIQTLIIPSKSPATVSNVNKFRCLLEILMTSSGILMRRVDRVIITVMHYYYWPVLLETVPLAQQRRSRGWNCISKNWRHDWSNG